MNAPIRTPDELALECQAILQRLLSRLQPGTLLTIVARHPDDGVDGEYFCSNEPDLIALQDVIDRGSRKERWWP